MNINSNSILRESKQIEDQIIEYRRELHQNPEIAYKEFETTEFIAKKLEDFNIEYKKGIGNEEIVRKEMERTGETLTGKSKPTGVIGYIKGGRKGGTVGLRADIDALPIEETHKPEHIPNKEGFRSTRDGCMHACGHDTHTAMLLGAAKILSENRKITKGNIKLIFQPAEEKGAGARMVIKSGEAKDIDIILGMHVSSSLEKGKVMINDGPMKASADLIELKIEGGGGHGAAPWETKDPLVASTNIVSQIYEMMNREIDAREPTVLSICQLNSGTAFNVIPDSSKMKGTIRTLNKEVREQIIKRIRDIGNSIASLYDLEFSLKAKPIFKHPLINSSKVVKVVKKAAQEIFNPENVGQGKPSMGAEDFAYYLESAPGAYLFLGTGEKGTEKPHHKPNFDIDESILYKGSALYVLSVIKYFQSHSM